VPVAPREDYTDQRFKIYPMKHRNGFSKHVKECIALPSWKSTRRATLGAQLVSEIH
jgi:hypothetical protein